ncbi:exonuclease domain-containing protein [Cytobacillus kochii]|uniref:exonuclease domain-containing protein n=1 Tax=Cytobacillus kochii TaxID=859143 RepID=UPI00203F280F|nr:exonuclease domain-containing protein [Cytobacillus kochii]MCM3323282.1 exonuclease domain-containing protein [Cytobacillus kochii]MCM3345677.1 exonuclease domain-containing protein [Cytobacillus kochii]
MKNFIAFDFETANSSRHSICSVGMVIVKEGKIVDSIYQLINPEEEFDGFNISIHHITPHDVKNSPTFDVFYNSIRDKIDNQLMVAHYLAFDGYALRDNLTKYEIHPCNNQLLCTYQLSKRLLRGKPSYSLDTLCQYYGIELPNHHHALADAQACAELMLKLTDEHELLDFDSIFNKTRIRPGILSPNDYRSSLVSKNKGKIDLSEIEISSDADTENPFYGKNIVFTGKLNLFTRKEAAQLIANKGGIPQNGINKETNYIILGDFEEVMIKGNKSSKLEKAEKMINEGKELEIISEEDFIKMI